VRVRSGSFGGYKRVKVSWNNIYLTKERMKKKDRNVEKLATSYSLRVRPHFNPQSHVKSPGIMMAEHGSGSQAGNDSYIQSSTFKKKAVTQHLTIKTVSKGLILQGPICSRSVGNASVDSNQGETPLYKMQSMQPSTALAKRSDLPPISRKFVGISSLSE